MADHTQTLDSTSYNLPPGFALVADFDPDPHFDFEDAGDCFGDLRIFRSTPEWGLYPEDPRGWRPVPRTRGYWWRPGDAPERAGAPDVDDFLAAIEDFAGKWARGEIVPHVVKVAVVYEGERICESGYLGGVEVVDEDFAAVQRDGGLDDLIGEALGNVEDALADARGRLEALEALAAALAAPKAPPSETPTDVRVYFDPVDVEIDGCGWNVVEEPGAVAYRFATHGEALNHLLATFGR